MSDESEDVEADATETEEVEPEEVEETPEPGGDQSDPEVESSDEEASDVDAGAEEDDGLGDGDFVRIDYTARTADGGQLVDTTDPEVAEEEGVADEGEFAPRVIVLGAGHVFEAVEEAIVGGETGDTGAVTVPAEQAFGLHDDDQVRTVSADKIPEDDRYPGAQVTVDGEQGYLETIVGGRARVDFNHPLAGEDIEYEFEVLEEVTDQLERAEGLFSMFLDLPLEMHIEVEDVEEERVEYPDEDELEEDEEPEPETHTETVEKTSLYVESTPQLSMNQQWMFQKQQIAQEIIDKTGIDRIVVQEVLDASGGMGMPGMMGGMGGMGGGEGGDIEEALEEADIDADEIVEEIEGEGE